MNDKTSANSNAPMKSLALLARAAASAEAEEAESSLPRLLRYALAAQDVRENLRSRLLVEIVDLVPELEKLAELWADDPEIQTKLLANALDTLAADRDRPPLIALADTVRLLGVSDSAVFVEEHRRVAAALTASLKRIVCSVDGYLRVRLETVALGWSLVASGAEQPLMTPAYQAARYYADARTKWIAQAAAAEVERHYESAKIEAESKSAEDAAEDPSASADAAPEGFVRVCDVSEGETKAKKLKEIAMGHEHVIGTNVPLAPTPDLAAIRAIMMFEFPYAICVIDRLLEDLVSRRHVFLAPTILLGPPGCGKSRLSRRLADLLGAGSWRCDASAADGAVIGGTARRWYSAEPAHPFLAISRTRFANPVFLNDDLEKAGTRSDYGRFWDSLLGLLEPETAARYPDPALQTQVDVSHVSYLATANSLDALPAPLRDRMRVLEFPEPRADDLPRLLPAVIDQLARDRGLDGRWFEPLSPAERDAVAAHWHGGTVRRLKAYVEAVLREREAATARH